VEQFLGFALPGIPYGCSYALMAVGLVLTYQATGVFNFAFGAQAYASAYLFAWLIQNQGLPIWMAFVLAVVLFAPGLGLLFDRLLFSRIPNTNNTAKIVTGISLAVGIPQLLPVIFGTGNVYNVPSVAFNPNIVYFRLPGTPVNGTFLSSVVFTAGILVALVVLMRLTPLGLQMRGAVESRRLVQLDGVNATRVVAVAWMASGLMAGLAGVLLAPVEAQLQSQDYITLMVAAIAGAAWAVLRSMPIAALVAVLVGVASLTLQGYLPTTSFLFSAVLPSLPFFVLVLALLFVPGLRSLEESKDPLASVDPPPPPVTATIRSMQFDRVIKVLWYGVLAAFVVSMLTWMPKNWESVFNAGLAFSTIFLSITLITGMGGQLSLCQATLAGVGAFTAAQLANHLGIAMPFGGLIGAGAAAVVAVVLAVASLRLRGLGLALLTLAAALLFDNAVFSQSSVSSGQGGLNIPAKWLGPINFDNATGHAYFVLAIAVLAVCTVAVLQIRRGSVGSFLSAMRGSEEGAAGIGINLTWQRILVFALSGVVAGLGGTLLSIQLTNVNPNQFNYELGLAFVVIVVTTGVTTVEGAIQGGISYMVIQQLLTYAPQRFQGLTFVLFAFGALTYAKHPEGILEFQKRRWTQRFERLVLRPAADDAHFGPKDAVALGAEGGLGGRR